MMNKTFILKTLGMLGLVLFMSIAVSYVNDIILERQRNQQLVQNDIARSYTREQTMIGPVLVVPYTEEYTGYVNEYAPNGAKTEKAVIKYRHAKAYFLPENLSLTGDFGTEHKKRGIYKALMYALKGTIKGGFHLPANFGVKPRHKDGKITFKSAYISFGISDTRGINGTPNLNFNQNNYKLAQGSKVKALGNGIHANLGQLPATAAQTHAFELKLNIRGMEDFHFTPIGESSTISLASSWPHPRFAGSFLPNQKQINNQGFKGEWSISSLSSSNQASLKERLTVNEEEAGKVGLESLSVSFIEPINVYSQADRATKYGLLFIGLTFVGFFLYEVLKQLRIHPAQYTLVGLSMAMFYLLLVSFAEMIGFTYAYLGASAACVLLLGYYLSFVLKSKKHGLVFSGFLVTLYGALYGILASEDNALLMGSLLVFGLLTATMVITRKVDWYALSAQKP